MKVQTRLALTLGLGAVPLFVAAIWIRSEVHWRSHRQGLYDYLAWRLDRTDRAACEADPGNIFAAPRAREASRRGDGERPVRTYWTYVYDESFRSHGTRAPEFPAALRRRMEAGERLASNYRHPYVSVAFRTGWTGPCSYFLAVHTERRDPRRDGSVWAVSGALIGALLLLTWAAAWPPVKRIQRLTREVREAASTRYRSAVSVKGPDEIGDLARAFNEAGGEIRARLAEVEDRSRALREFLAATTHDVMVPLTVLQGHLDALVRDPAGSEESRASSIRGALSEAHYLGSLVHNLRAAALLEAGGLALGRHPVDLNRLVERVADRHRPLARSCGIGFDCAVPERTLRTEGDVTLLEQAVSNLVHNAVRHNRQGGHAALLLEEEGGERFQIRVLDDGPGIPPERLAEPAGGPEPDEARTRGSRGTGLGLRIAREAALRHGMRLSFERPETGGLEAILEGLVLPGD